MEIHFDIEALPAFRNAVITIGTFDGVHKGHRKLIDTLREEAVAIGGETVIITFHPHPRKVVSSSQPEIRLINTLDEKLVLLEQLGVEHVVVVPFTDSFAHQSADEYIRNFLVEKFHPHTLIVGYDHRFGKERKGDYRLLEKMAPEFNYRLLEIPRQVLDEIAVSSTRIRGFILEGKVEEADKLLGYDFFFSGTVVRGDQLGRELGYPTANLNIADNEKLIPGDGIYAVYAVLADPSTGPVRPVPVKMKGMMSIGFRPTVGGTSRVIEVNLFDFDLSIYGRSLTVFVKRYLRPELHFESLEALVQQMGVDKVNSLRNL